MTENRMLLPMIGNSLRLQIEYVPLTALKNNGGMGSLYRSQHEFVFVFKCGAANHINNFEPGKHGRNRTNVWEYRGINSFGAAAMNS